ncbi:RHS repeat-associated core domain-containing protein [Paenibacillus oryzisoli]|uniref:RHS repeat-associated core domain-containing protein n=1 Tax=Paenibacillus oryzisoli TaxID=1850517 RepID=UPI003D2AFCF7
MRMMRQLTQVKQYNDQTAATPSLTDYTYDTVGNRLTKQSAWDTLASLETYSYDGADKLLHWQNGSNYKDFTYDPRGNLLRIMGIDGDDDAEESAASLLNPTVLSQVYGSGPVTNSVYGTSSVSAQSANRGSAELLEEYIWNSANRLKQQRNPKGDVSQYFYDGDGNRTKMTVDVAHGPTDHSDGGNGQGNSNGNGNNGNGNGNNGNNGNGNGNNGNGNGNGPNKCHEVPPGFIPPGLAKKCGQVEEPYPDMHPGGPREGWEKEFKKKHWEFNYTNDVSLALPEPLQVTDKDQLSGANDYYRWKETYAYGAGGERISMTYLPAYDANNGWDPHDGTAGAEPGVAPRTLFYLNDALGSPLSLIEKDGRVSSRFHYDEFGIPTDAKKFDVNWPGPDSLFGYTGLGYDYYSGLSYARARYYKPELGRFVSEDTYKGQIDNPLSLNLYTYVANNPLTRIDPSGHDWLDKLSGGLDSVADAITFGGYSQVINYLAGENETEDYQSGYEQSMQLIDDASNALPPADAVLLDSYLSAVRLMTVESRVARTGGRVISITEWERREKVTLELYSKFRASNDSVKTIANNVGMEESKIQIIKDHLFHNDIKFADGRVEPFARDYPIAIAWERLGNATYNSNDLLLLEHEYFEATHMSQFGSNYETAHEAANALYNWQQAIKGLYD